jgi:hypothetical protein
MKLSISIKKINYWLFGTILALNGFSLFLRFLIRYVGLDISDDLWDLFDTAHEANITSWFSSELLLIAGALLLLIARVKSHSNDTFTRHWHILSGIFFFLSMDEIASLHEKLITPLREATGASGIFYFAWVIVAIPMILLLVFLFSRFLIALPRKTAIQFVVSGAIFVAGAIGLEMLGGMFHGQFLIYRALTAIEETLENLGAGLFIMTLLIYAKSNLGNISGVMGSKNSDNPVRESSLIAFEISN